MLNVQEKINQNITINKVTIGVTPQFRQRNTVICDIDPPTNFKKGGHISLPRGTSTLEFTLQAGDPSGLKFRTKPNGSSDAFWCDSDSCPVHETMDSQYNNPQVSSDGATLTVDVNPSGQLNAVFYRLNFDDGCSFDPIIIHQ